MALMMHDQFGTPPGSMSPSSACSSDNGDASDLDDFLLGPDGGSLFEGFETTREALTIVENDESAATTPQHFAASPAPFAFKARMARRRSTGSAGYTRDTRLPAPHAIDKSQRFAWKAETERILAETREKLESYAHYRALLDDAHDWDGSGRGAQSRKRRRAEYEAERARSSSSGSSGASSPTGFESGLSLPRAKRSAMTAKQRLQARKDRKNRREKQRRSDVNVMFMTLIDMLGLRPDIKSDKVTILSGAVNHINALREQNAALMARVRGQQRGAGSSANEMC